MVRKFYGGPFDGAEREAEIQKIDNPVGFVGCLVDMENKVAAYQLRTDGGLQFVAMYPVYDTYEDFEKAQGIFKG